VKPQVLLVFARFEECLAMVKGIAQYNRTHQSWVSYLDDAARAEDDVAWLRSQKWRGVISRHTTRAFAKRCAALGLPLVDLNDMPLIAGVPKIRPDNGAIGRLGAEHFLERGHHSFGFAGFKHDVWARERRDGFVARLQEAGQRCDVFDVVYPGDLTPFWDAKQSTALSSWLRRLPRPTAVMACNDLRALQVLTAAHALDMRVPEEIAVLGVNNDTTRCELAHPPLSSVAPDPFRSGYLAAELLDRLLSGGKAPNLDQRVEPRGVIVRPSTDMLAIDDRNVVAALGYIREHACSGLTVDEVLRHAAASRSQLERKFRRLLGRTPQAEIRRVQLAKIRQLLLETDFPLKRIAELSGFTHVEYMCVVYKRLTGEAPGAYRRRHAATTA
jgi:LacI family transcriptional regulator